MIYLDNNATTPTDPRVVDAMLPYFFERFGNAASRHHGLGWEAETAVAQARGEVAQLIGVEDSEIVFTSGATESNNLAIRGVFDLYKRKGNHIITVKTEHKAVLDVCYALERMGAEITMLDVNEDGLIDLGELENAIKDTTILVSVMWANNETGVIQPLRKIGEICSKHGAQRSIQVMHSSCQSGAPRTTSFDAPAIAEPLRFVSRGQFSRRVRR